MIMVIINLCLNFDDNIILNLFINIFSTSFPSQHVRILSYRPSSLIFHTMDIGHTHTWSLCYCQSFSQHGHHSNYHLHHCILDISCWSRVLNAWATRFWVSIYLSIHIATHLCSELLSDVPGFVMHFLKHLFVIFWSNSCALAMASCCLTSFINSSLFAGSSLALEPPE